MVDRSNIPHRDWDSSAERDSGSRRSLVPRDAVGPIRADVVGHRLHFCWRDLVLQSGLAEKTLHFAFLRRLCSVNFRFLHALSLPDYSPCPILAFTKSGKCVVARLSE